MRPCVVWQGCTTDRGYGQRKVGGKMQYVHRLEWEKHHGPIPRGMRVCHTCDNPPCHEITHLFLGTAKDNSQDMVRKGRSAGQKKTHCPHGHEYSPENTSVRGGKRYCRSCQRTRNRGMRSC